MKIEDIKGIESKLPEIGSPAYNSGKDKMLQYILNTDIDINDVAEVDVEKVFKLLALTFISRKEWSIKELQMAQAQVIAKSNCIRWRDK